MLAAVTEKWKSPIYQLSVLAILAQVIGQFLVCVALDFVISPYVTSQSFLGLASLGVSLCNQITMIFANLAALILIYILFKTERLIFAGWCVIGGLCILLRIAAFILAFGVFLPFVNGTYQGLNFAVNPAFVPYSLTLSADAIVESVFICMTSVVFIRHIIQKLELPTWEVAREIVLKYGGLKFLMLIGIRFFGAGLIFKLMASGFVADNISNMANCNLIDCRPEYHPSVLGHLYHPSDSLLCTQELGREEQHQQDA
ncbi:hypothetical protein EDD86DRAFT_212512 [Gorgonomyces haynaldii]|nr:hypothetical protein EDD86DRAFT_212512 [Gorgonomyces haynaldii]